MFLKIIKIIIRKILDLLPLLHFPKLNCFLFRVLGHEIDYSVRINSSVKIWGEIVVTILHNTYVGHDTVFTGGKANVNIGSNCDISDKVSFVCGTHSIDKEGTRIAGKGYSSDIKVDNGVWIGYGAIVLPGVTIGEKSIIAAGCVVYKNVPKNVLVAGNPMRIIRQLD